MSRSSEEYGEDYFERGQELGISGYSNYRWIPELTIPMCAEICERMSISRGATILDYGCAKGYMVSAFRLLGRDAFGVDASEYAIEHAHEIARGQIFWSGSDGIWTQSSDFLIAKDVLEHMEPEKIGQVRPSLANRALIVVPLGDGERYVIPQYEHDVTHKIRQPLDWWAEKMRSIGWKVDAATYEWGTLKANWVRRYPKGNGFLELSRPSRARAHPPQTKFRASG